MVGGVEGDQEAEGGGTSTASLLSRQARCVLTLLCRVRLLATTGAGQLSLSLLRSLLGRYVLFLFLSLSSILTPTFLPFSLLVPSFLSASSS